MAEVAPFDMDLAALAQFGKAAYQSTITKGDFEVAGNIKAYNFPTGNWSLVEYIVRIIQDAAIQDAQSLKIALGSVTATLDPKTLTENLNTRLEQECFPLRGVIAGFTHKSIQDSDEVWRSETIAHVALRHVGIEDLMDGPTEGT